MNLRPATTVLLLRPAGAGGSRFEVFLVQRHRNSGFLPNAWVFPGGRVDARDALHGHPRVRGGAGLLDRLGAPPAEAAAFCVAGVRETFEEAGIWLGTGSLPDALRGAMDSGAVSLAEALERHDATLDLDRLRPWSWWITPEVEPKRFNTRFLLAVVAGHEGRHDDREVVDSGWFDPAVVMREARHGAFPMAPPTWWTLFELSRLPHLDAVLAEADRRELTPILPIMRFDDAGIHLLLPGHAEHPAPRVPGLPTNVEFEQGAWVAWVGDERVTFP